jgi:hypothetical protein
MKGDKTNELITSYRIFWEGEPMTLIINGITHPAHLHWWQWAKIGGLFLPILLFCLGVEHPWLWALAAHCLIDFTFQSDETAAGKRCGDGRVLAYHAFISGGYAGLIAGGLAGLALSVAIHFLVDATNKFGLKGPAGPILDQAAHMMTLVIIWWWL